MTIIIDTNIIFSCLLNPQNQLAKLLFFNNNRIKYYSCNYMLDEIANHWEKLKVISKLDDKSLQTSYFKILTCVNFVNEELIPSNIWRDSENICSNFDVYDTDFVALTKYLDGHLWTGDKKLIEYFKTNPYIKTINSQELNQITFNI